MTYNSENKNSFINEIQKEKEELLSASQSNSKKYYKISKSIIIICSITFSIMLLIIAGLTYKQVSTNKYSAIRNIEELISIKDFQRAEQLCYQNLYNDDVLSGYYEGALLRIAGEYAASGNHKSSKLILEKVLSANPESFVGRISLVVTSILSGDMTGATKSLADIPNITAYIPNISTIIGDFTVDNILNTKGLIEYLMNILLYK